MSDEKIKHLPQAVERRAPEDEAAGDGNAGEDRIFADPATSVSDFKFDEKTASVFDDMVSRSVPFYGEMQRMVSELAADFAVPGTNLYDLGCATGTTLLALDQTVDPGVRFVGVDNASDMLDKARAKLEAAGMTRPYALIEADLHKFHEVENASLVAMVLTLQFIRPLYRHKMLGAICEGMQENGCLILVEKLTLPNSMLNRLMIQYYYDYKRRNGYSETEISQKREALENVLIPYRYEENREMLLEAGFRDVEEFFRWHNFCAMLAVK